MTRPLWLAWENDTSIRSRVLAEEIGAEYRAITYFDGSVWFAWMRYPVALIVTCWRLIRSRGRAVVVQNPSILLAAQAAFLRSLFHYHLTIDLHTPFSRRRGLARWVADTLHTFGLRHCDAVIVTNEAFRRRVAAATDARVMVLPDRIPRLPESPPLTTLRGRRRVLYVCTFAEDEPWRAVLEAAEQLPDGIVLYISGRARLLSSQVPPNVELTGYLPLDEYQRLLQSVDAIMVLTTAEENLVCGGYEAVAARKPLILSGTVALRDYFRRGVVYTTNDADAIAAAIVGALEQLPTLSAEISTLRSTLLAEWERDWDKVLEEVGVERPIRPGTAGVPGPD